MAVAFYSLNVVNPRSRNALIEGNGREKRGKKREMGGKMREGEMNGMGWA